MSIIAPTAPTSVYRYYDRDGVLLYVGITSRRTTRQAEHNADKEWWSFVTRQAVDHYPTRPEAESRERDLIRKYHPPFNVQHNPGHAEMRTIYLTQRAIADEIPTKETVGPAARRWMSSLGHRIPLRRVKSGRPDRVVFASDPRHLALVKEVQFPQDVILRSPAKIGSLVGIQWDGDRCLFAFQLTTAGQKIPATAHLKIRNTKRPISIYAYEVAA